ncbi:hypothetical protein ACFQJ7_17260 [Halovenus rubra]|uniref:Uncharacterized protein n=2 Tax=Halovenus rubra TaxID=869890 RepID=A0ABD5XDU2_9EURY|nr:hypothetical protein [Halovenus rubra]
MDIDADCFLHGTVRPVYSGWVLEYDQDGPTIPLADPDGVLDGQTEQECTVGVDVVDPTFTGVEYGSTGVRLNGEQIVLVGDVRGLDTLIERSGSRVVDLTFDSGCWPVAPENATVSTTNSPSALPCRRNGHENKVKIEASALEARQLLSSPDPFGEEPIDTVQFEYDPTRDRVRIVVPGVPLWANHGWLTCRPGRFFNCAGKWAKAAIDSEPSPWDCGDAPTSKKLDFEYGVEGDVLRIRPRVSATPLGVYPADGFRFDCDGFVQAWVRDARQFLADSDPDEADSLRETVEEFASHTDDAGPDRR